MNLTILLATTGTGKLDKHINSSVNMFKDGEASFWGREGCAGKQTLSVNHQ